MCEVQRERRVIIAESSERLDKVIQIDGITRSGLQTLFAEGCVRVGGKPVAKNYKPKVGEEIEVILPELKELSVEAEEIPLDIRYEDEDLLVVNKPKGMVVHPAPGNYSGTLVNALLFHCKGCLSGINGVIRPGIVHRIDKDTSGLLVVAKNDFAHRSLAEQIKEHSCKREYRAVLYGNLKEDKGTVDAPIGRHISERKQMSVTSAVANTREAVTHYEVIERLKGFTYAKFHLETGRTHQIRVHMAYLGNPIAGDPVYGPKKVITELHGQCLHAATIGFVHPRTGEFMEITSELPDYFKRFLKKLGAVSEL